MKTILLISLIILVLIIAPQIPKATEVTVEYIKNSQLAQSILPFSNTRDSSQNNLNMIEETISKEAGQDSSPFWLNSGALFYLQNNLAQTIQGDLPTYSNWRLLYSASNPKDSDSGFHPQNIFRLITKAKYENTVQQMYVLITKDNLSISENRNTSNGVFLMNRYQDVNNLYYAGIRVDGTVVIKEKVSGVYHTLAQKQLLPGDIYGRNTNPSLIPKHVWIGLKTEVKTMDPKTVVIKLYTDLENSGIWNETLTATDTPEKGALPLTSSGNGGIRTDFMDVEFHDYKIDTIQI